MKIDPKIAQAPTAFSMNPTDRAKAYAICKQRGHEADYGMTNTVVGAVTKNHCRYCGTWFWTETTEHEEGAPE